MLFRVYNCDYLWCQAHASDVELNIYSCQRKWQGMTTWPLEQTKLEYAAENCLLWGETSDTELRLAEAGIVYST